MQIYVSSVTDKGSRRGSGTRLLTKIPFQCWTSYQMAVGQIDILGTGNLAYISTHQMKDILFDIDLKSL